MALMFISTHRGVLSRLGEVVRYQWYSKKVNVNTIDQAENLSQKYTPTRTQLLLDCLNNLNLGDKRQKDVEPSIVKVKQFINASGDLKSLQDLIDVVGLSTDEAVNLCDKLVAVMTKKKKKIQLCYPPLPNSVAQNVRNVVCIHSSLSCVSWAHLETSGRVLSWDVESFLMPDNQQHNVDCINVALKFRDKLPEGELYFTESPDVRRSKHAAEAREAFLENGVRHALLTVAGCRQLESGRTAMVYSSNRLLVPLLFDLAVGRETTARYKVVEEILQEMPIAYEDNSLYSKIVVDNWLKDRFAARNVYEKEQLAQPLLAAIAFMNVVVKHNPHCIEKLNAA